MKQPVWTQALFATSLALAFSLAPSGFARAELVSEEVQQDAIIPEHSSVSAMEDEVVILKKRPAAAPATPAPRRRVVVQEESLPLEPVYEPAAAPAQAQAVAVATAAPAAPTVGSSLDQGIQNKMDDVKTQFETALLKTLDKIKITVDDGDSVAAATPVTTTIVQDSVVTTNAAAENAYLSVNEAPAVAEENVVVAEEVESADSIYNKFRVAPVGGWSTINSDYYEVDSQFTAGLNIEVDVAENLAVVAGWTYSQFDVGMAVGSPYPGYGQPMPGMMPGMPGMMPGMATMQYNQNVFDAGLRLYLFPRNAPFRAFIGGGLGFNKGYLNYRATPYAPQFNSFEDYVVTSFLGTLETGAEVRLSKSISLGANFKYANVLTTKNSQPNYNNSFYPGYDMQQAMVGGSLAEDSFYSILGTVKFRF